MKIVLCAAIGIIALSLAACSKDNEERPSSKAPKSRLRNSEPTKKLFHGDMETSATPVSGSPLLRSMKGNHLELSSTKTIGEVFDSYKYAINKEWRDTTAKTGPYYIDYVCSFEISPVSSVALKEGVVKRSLEIKFVVHDDGETYITMATRVDTKTDGMVHTTHIDPPGIKKIVTAIYENREITF